MCRVGRMWGKYYWCLIEWIRQDGHDYNSEKYLSTMKKWFMFNEFWYDKIRITKWTE